MVDEYSCDAVEDASVLVGRRLLTRTEAAKALAFNHLYNRDLPEPLSHLISIPFSEITQSQFDEIVAYEICELDSLLSVKDSNIVAAQKLAI